MRRPKPLRRFMEKRGGTSGSGASGGGGTVTATAPAAPADVASTNVSLTDAAPIDAPTGRFSGAINGRSLTFAEQQAWGNFYQSVPISDVPTELRKRYKDNRDIAAAVILNAAVQPENIRAVRDRDGNMQAAALIAPLEDRIYVDFIATAPWNVTGGTPTSVKGAGKALMAEIVRESIRLGHEGRIELEALPSARSFYTSIGFTKSSGKDYILSPEAARRFLDAMDE